MKLKHLLAGVVLMGASGTAMANECETTIEANDAMQFNTSEMTIPSSCDEFTVTLKHTGKLPKAAMGHNWVMSTKGDMQGVVNDGVSAGLDNNYIKPNDDRVIAYTDVIGGGKQTSVSLDVSGLSADESYMFFCSFPGHSSVMKGTVMVK
ncbi:azurin [Alteromonas halophila]|uniref:Azurin n=1 Tax=Alteromonas halophila TaxID=516698 RepID=A0A918JN05_9ALTE|nr:azurin [Alteromonas halophila]GGW84735.1 azurin [Alteromonas halophila]